MSLAYPASRWAIPVISRGCCVPVALAWLGIGLGFACFASTLCGADVTERRLLQMATLPSPAEITAYTTAICGAIITAVNTAFLVWHKMTEPRRPRRRKVEHGKDRPSKDVSAPTAP